MNRMRNWGIVMSVGLLVIFSGLYLVYAGGESEQSFDSEWVVNTAYVYYFRLDAAGGKPITSSYSLSQGNMTIAFMSGEGFRQLTEESSVDSNEVFHSLEEGSAGTISWTPDKDRRCYLVFYGFTNTGAMLTVDGTFTASLPVYRYAGVAVIVAGAVILAVGGLKMMKARIVGEDFLSQEAKTFGQEPPGPPRV